MIALPCKRSYETGVEFIAQVQGILQSITNAIKTGTRPLKCLFDIFLIFQRVKVSVFFSFGKKKNLGKKKKKTLTKCESDARHERLLQRCGGWTKFKTLTRWTIVRFDAFARPMDQQASDRPPAIFSTYLHATHMCASGDLKRPPLSTRNPWGGCACRSVDKTCAQPSSPVSQEPRQEKRGLTEFIGQFYTPGNLNQQQQHVTQK